MPESIGITRATASQRRRKRQKTKHPAKSARYANSSIAKNSTTPSTQSSKKKTDTDNLQVNNTIDLTDENVTINTIPTETLNYSNFCPPNSLMSNTKMDMVIEKIREHCPHEVYIAESSATTYCRLYNTTWTGISSLFGSPNVRHKPNGVYLFPFFSGDQNFGHWHLITLKKTNNNWSGWIINSLPTPTDIKTLCQKTIMDLIRTEITLTEVKCIQQQELECGPRTLLHITTIIQKLKNTTIMDDIMDSLNLHSTYSTPQHLPEFLRYICTTIALNDNTFPDIQSINLPRQNNNTNTTTKTNKHKDKSKQKKPNL